MASFLRSNIMRRGGDSTAEQSPGQEEPQREQRGARGQDQEERPRGSASFSRRFVPALFTGRSGRSRDDSSSSEEEPKTPRPEAPDSAPSGRMRLARPWTRGSSRSRPPTTNRQEATAPSWPRPSSHESSSNRRDSGTSSVNTAQYPGLPTPLPPAATAPEPAPRSRSSTTSSSSTGRRRFEGPDPAELHLAELADSGRRRRERRHRRRDGSGDRSSRRTRRYEGGYESEYMHRSRDTDVDSNASETPRHFLFCFPWVRSRRMRAQILKCFVSGLFMLIMLSVYLALSITNRVGTSTFTIMLILMILFATIIFCHGLVRICMLLMGHGRGRDDDDDPERGGRNYPYQRDMAEVLGPGGYAVPRRPIRVVLARDEEAVAGEHAPTTKLEPPAYGAWRESVRIDPNRFFWQRNEAAASSTASGAGSDAGSGSDSGSRPNTAARPPSYASDDGVDYVIEARPRSIAPPLSEIAASSGVTPPAPAASGPESGGGRMGSAGTLWPSTSSNGDNASGAPR